MILQAQNLEKWFGTEKKTHILHKVSLQVSYGEMLFIVGPSGSGKTTLLSIISGILRPNSGEVIIKDKNIWQLAEDKLADFRLYYIGFVFQDFHLFPKLTSKENVAIPLVLQKNSWLNSLERAEKILTTVGLKERLESTPSSLSVGEQQRVAIARAIVTEPSLLILDEPTASLDGETGKKIINFIKTNLLNDKRAIIVVTHDNRIFEYASRIIYLEDGKIISKAKYAT